jgi:hypothetical protein
MSKSSWNSFMAIYVKWTVFCFTNHKCSCHNFDSNVLFIGTISFFFLQIKCWYDCSIWFCADYWRVPEVSYRPSHWEILWWMYSSQNKAWSLFQGGCAFLLYGSLFFSSWGLYFIIPITRSSIFFWQKALKRKANFEQSKKLKERLQAFRKEITERSTEENNLVQS